MNITSQYDHIALDIYIYNYRPRALKIKKIVWREPPSGRSESIHMNQRSFYLPLGLAVPAGLFSCPWFAWNKLGMMSGFLFSLNYIL